MFSLIFPERYCLDVLFFWRTDSRTASFHYPGKPVKKFVQGSVRDGV